MKRNIDYLLRRNIIWIRKPITDKPDIENDQYVYYENGTHQCYELFRGKAQITTYRSLKWHLLVLWYLNPQLDQDEFMGIAEVIANKQNGFIAFNIHPELLFDTIHRANAAFDSQLAKVSGDFNAAKIERERHATKLGQYQDALRTNNWEWLNKEIAKYRAARRIWAKELKNKYI